MTASTRTVAETIAKTHDLRGVSAATPSFDPATETVSEIRPTAATTSTAVVESTELAELCVQPCPQTSADWHWSQLVRLRTDRPEGAAVKVRLDYHRCLFESQIKGLPELPLVSIVIPAFNETPEILGSTLQSAFDQTYPNCEVILVDDGAAVPLIDMIPQFADHIRYFRQDNQGVPAARNRGIAEARGHFIHFLDADDLLDPTAVEEKVNVFHRVADVDVCFSLYRSIGDNGVKSAQNITVPPIGDPLCPSRGLMRTNLRRFPFQISTMMFPRWFLLDLGPFDTTLRQAQDNRQWFRLGVRNAKVAGLNKELTTRRFRPGSLTSNSNDSLWYNLRACILNFEDICRDPQLWTTTCAYVPRLFTRPRWEFLFGSTDERLPAMRTWLIEILQGLRKTSARTGFSYAPLVESLRCRLIEYRFDRTSATASDFFRDLIETLDDLSAEAPDVTEADLELWLNCPVVGQFLMTNQPALRLLELHLPRAVPKDRIAFWRGEFRRAYWEAAPPETSDAATSPQPANQKQAA